MRLFVHKIWMIGSGSLNPTHIFPCHWKPATAHCCSRTPFNGPAIGAVVSNGNVAFCNQDEKWQIRTVWFTWTFDSLFLGLLTDTTWMATCSRSSVCMVVYLSTAEDSPTVHAYIATNAQHVRSPIFLVHGCVCSVTKTFSVYYGVFRFTSGTYWHYK